MIDFPWRPLYRELLERLSRGEPLCLATVIQTEGSAPQVPGAAAIFSEAGLVEGTIGGGVLEAAAASTAAACLRDRRARLVRTAFDADIADAEGAICGGAATVLFDPGVDEEAAVFRAAVASRAARTAGLLLALVRPLGGEFASVARDWVPADRVAGGRAGVPGDFDPRAVLAGREPRLFESGGLRVFAEPILPPERLIVAGAGHVGKAVAHLGRLLGFEVVVVDDRPEFADPAQVPDADRVIAAPYAEALAGLPPAPDDFIVIVTPGHRRDAEALRASIGRGAAYVGMIGSRSKIEAMRAEFLSRGWAAEESWSRVHAPIGLPIGSRTVAEIAVSIAAELVKTRSRFREEAADAASGGGPAGR